MTELDCKKYPYLELKAKEAVDYAVKKNAIVIMTVDGFITDHEALYLRDLLWYARDNKVVVHLVPKD